MEGGRLIEHIRNRNQITELEIAGLMSQICAAVSHLHSLGVAHRDLKPENLLFAKKNNDSLLKLADFGFAKLTNCGLHSQKFTPLYVAPEILKFSKYNQSCDIWSLGVIMYILCCGEPPFQSESRFVFTDAMKNRIKRGMYTFEAPEWSLVSEDAKELIRNMLEVNPAKRFTIDQVIMSKWMQRYKEAPEVPLSGLDKIKSSFNFLNNDKTLGLIFDQMRVDYPLSDFKLKTITEITDNELLNKRISGATRKSSIMMRDDEINSIDEQQSQLTTPKTVETNRPLNLILIALRYSFILNKSEND